MSGDAADFASQYAAAPIDARKRADQVRERLVSLIRDGHFREGEKLPTEPQLSQMFGVGRSSIREAVQSLIGTGLIEMRPGQGAFVRRFDVSDIVRLASGIVRLDYGSALELHEARVMLELTAARLAAHRRTDADLILMAESIERYIAAEEVGDIDGMVAEDVTFHAAMVGATRNHVLATMLESISGVMREHRRTYMLNSLDEERGLVVAEHKGILQAVAAGDQAEAVRKVRAHMRLIWNQVRRNLDHAEAARVSEEDLLAVVDQDSVG